MTSPISTMHVDLRPGESLYVGDSLVTVVKIEGKRARLMINAPRTTPIKRQEALPIEPAVVPAAAT